MISEENLRRYPYFAGADPQSMRTLAMSTEELGFAEGDVLFEDDATADYLLILTRGEVDICYKLNDGSHSTVDTRVAGDLLVWSSVVEPFRCTARGIARTKGSYLAIDASSVRRVCDQNRRFGYALMQEITKIVSQRLAAARVQLAAEA